MGIEKMKYKAVSKACLSMVLIGAMVGTSFVTATATENFKDIPQDWSRNAVLFAVENGIMKGYDGYIQAERFITRAELSAMLGRLFMAEKQSDLSAFTDVEAQAWYSEELAKAVEMGIIYGADGQMRPNDLVTREEAFVMLARALCMDNNETYALTGFDDANEVSNWAVNAIGFLVSQKIVSGSGNKISPKNSLTRAEFSQLVMRSAGTIVRESGMVHTDAQGNVLVLASNVMFENMTIEGSLIIADGVKSGTISLENVQVLGDVIVRGVNNTVSLDSKSSMSEIVLHGEGNVFLGEGNVRGNASIPTESTSFGNETGNTSSSGGSGGSSGGSGGSGGGSGSGNGTVSTTYSITMEQSFLLATTYTATLYHGLTMATGYTLYADGVAIAEDTDKNGTVTAPMALFDNAKRLEAVLQDGTKVVVAKK